MISSGFGDVRTSLTKNNKVALSGHKICQNTINKSIALRIDNRFTNAVGSPYSKGFLPAGRTVAV